MKATLRNELSKVFKNKMFILFVIFYVLFMSFSVYVYHDLVDQGKLTDFNRINFVATASTDIIYKPVIPIFTIIMTLLVMEVFVEDYAQGIMKHEIIKCRSRKDYFAGKLIYSLVFLIIVSILFYLITLVFGISFFKGPLSLKDVLGLLQLYLLNVIPNMAFISLVLIFSFYLKKGNGYKFIIIVLPIALNLISKIKGVGWALPLPDSYEIANHLDLNFNFYNSHQVTCLVQFFVFSFLSIVSWKNIEFDI